MSHALERRPSVTVRNLSPLYGGPEWLAFELNRQQMAALDQHSAGAVNQGSIVSVRYVGPNGVGRHFVESPEDTTKQVEVTSAPGLTGLEPGQYVALAQTRSGATLIGYAPGAEQGASAHPRSSVAVDLSIHAITSVLPTVIDTGTGTAVTLTGIGFETDDVFEAVKPDESTPEDPWQVDTAITLASVVVNSSVEATMTITPASSVGDNYSISLRVTRA